ncbi:MAG: TRZ/ATZ family hydrolase [Gammaproteobacteria bacterium]|jgi:5-methylthioadenosine/S-adenosylhomocysteine deaminase|nr:TRZ/ATZ family hydrolase [Gammaproteobacteria bacterium]
MSNRADWVLAPRWLIPVEPEGVVLENHALGVRDGVIAGIEPRAAAAEKWPDAEWVERPQHAVIPGLVNAHTHAAMNLLRGFADDLPLDTWLSEHIWPAEQRWADRNFVRDGVDLAVLEMIRGGTTCFQDMYMFPDEVAAVAAERGIRAVVSIIVIEAPTAWATTIDEYLGRGLEVHDRYRGHPLVTTAFGPHAPYTVGDTALERIVVLADQLELNIQMHVHETQSEVDQAVAARGQRPLARLNKLGLLTPALNAVHATALTDAEIELLAERGVHVIHCPESNMKLASGACRVKDLLAAGVNVALGTDGAASNNDLDMFGEMRSAALLTKLTHADAAALPAAAALRAATLSGAQALGLGETTGSLLPGKAADIVAVDLSAPACQPVHNALSQLVYSACRDQVTDVWVNGRQLYGEHTLQTADAEDVIARANAWQMRMRSGS